MLAFPGESRALESANTPAAGAPLAGEAVVRASSETAHNGGPNSPDRVLPGEPAVRKNYLLPAIEVPLFLLTLNAYDRLRYGEAVYGTNLSTFKNHVLHGRWEYDQDPFEVNQLAHPLQGAFMYGFARASGLNFWEGMVYSNAGSLLWKIGGETGNPSINDQVTTGNAGSLFGEELYRMGSLVLERGAADGEKPAAWRAWCAAAISPPTGLNRLLFGDRYKWMESRDPADFARLRFAQSGRALVTDSGSNAHDAVREQGTVDFSMDYGLPGKDGYRYIRPLDYFNFQITGQSTANDPLESVMTRGTLFADKYEWGDDYRGIWGLYGSYDYISPKIFRVSSTAASFGTTAQWSLSKRSALLGTALGGVGFGAAGTTLNPGDRNYHYGATPQGLIALRLVLDERVMLESTAREFLVSGLGGSEAGREGISRVDASATVRVWGRHALGIQYAFSHREANYAGAASHSQTVGIVSVAYNLLGAPDFGVVTWER